MNSLVITFFVNNNPTQIDVASAIPVTRNLTCSLLSQPCVYNSNHCYVELISDLKKMFNKSMTGKQMLLPESVLSYAVMLYSVMSRSLYTVVILSYCIY